MSAPQAVLLVEDDPRVREDARTVLAAEGFRVLAADTIASAKHVFASEKPGIVVLDVNLPDGSGLEFCAHVRAHKELAATPVIVLTGKGGIDDKAEGFEAGADQYLVKPVLPRELLMWVRALLRRIDYDQGGAGVLRVGDLEIDPKGFLVRFQGVALPRLTVKEFELLYFLVRKRPQAVSRKQILSTLWHTVAVDHVVDNHLMKLRRKLPPAVADRLQAVPGKGFRYFQ
ncbi:MAG: response regulator transcription factor [Elusimicrobia bacterium]|nr:response regulator transcription factor [Elusimicrobiota bacterium]